MFYSKISGWKEEITAVLIIFACLFLLAIFPVNGPSQKITSSLVFLFILPILYIRLILKESLAEFGLSLKNKNTGLVWGGIMLLVSLIIAFLLITFSKLKTVYLLPSYITASFWLFLVYELIFVNLFFFLQEFFFKGFVLFSFLKKFDYWAIVFSFFVFLILALATGASVWQLAPMLILSITGGIVAYKSRSFIYSYLMGLLFLIFFDAYLIYILK